MIFCSNIGCIYGCIGGTVTCIIGAIYYKANREVKRILRIENSIVDGKLEGDAVLGTKVEL